MCEIMERIREEGKREGEMIGRESGILDSIAKVVEEDISVVRQWLKPAK